METTEEKPLPEVKLRHFTPEDADCFYDMVDDDTIREFFEGFNAPREEILAKFTGLNDDIAVCQYWGVTKPDDALIGFVCLQRKRGVFQTLEKIRNQGKEEDLELLFESQEKREHRILREKAAAPYTIDIALHRDYRGQGYAKAALRKAIQYACSAGLSEVYLEIAQDNSNSIKLLTGLPNSLIADAADNFFHHLYKVDVKAAPHTTADAVRMRTLLSDEEMSAYNYWREVTGTFSELAAHRELLTSLFLAIMDKGVRIEPTKNLNVCHYTDDEGDKYVSISLKEREERLTLIWSIAHEYGHVCQPKPTENEQKLFTRDSYLREADAWDKAEKWLKDKPFYQHNWPDFIRFRNSRLEAYLPPMQN